MEAESTDSISGILRSAGWLEFEIAMHRTSRSAEPLSLDSVPPSDAADHSTGSITWPMEPLAALQVRRQSCRTFTSKPLDLHQVLDTIVPAFQTVDGCPSLAIPGAVSSISATVLVNRVNGQNKNKTRIEQGAYEVHLQSRTLHCIRLAPFTQLSSCVDISDLSQPAALVILSLHLERRRQYINAYELGLFEAGQLLQNLSLAATNTGLGCCVLGSVFDEPFWSIRSGSDDISTAVREHGVPIVAIALGNAAPAD